MFLLFACLATASCSGQDIRPDPPIDCDSCEAWNEPLAPFHIHGNTWYVGTAKLSAVLIDTGDGLILVDAALPQSASQIAANMRNLGFDPLDIRYIAVSHAHYDHVGGVAAFQRLTAAPVLAGPDAVDALRTGHSSPLDPQHGLGAAPFPAVADVRPVEASVPLRLGSVVLQGVPTPGHTPGGMSWTWQSCQEERCLNVVYADSLSAVSAPEYRFADGLGETLRQSAQRIASLDCDIFLTTHDSFFDLHAKLEADGAAFVAPGGCSGYAEKALERLERRLASEREAVVRVRPRRGK